MYSLLYLPTALSFSVVSGDSVNVWQLRTLPDALRPAPSRLSPCLLLLYIIIQSLTPFIDIALDGDG